MSSVLADCRRQHTAFQYMGLLYFVTTQNTKNKVRFSSLPLVITSTICLSVSSQHWDVDKQTPKVTRFFFVFICFHLLSLPTDAHRQSPPAMIGWAGGLLPTPSLQLLQYESTTPSALHHPFPAGFPLHTVGRGCQAPHRLPRNSLCRKSDAGDFSIIFCQPGRVWFIKMHFPFHMYFVLKQTNAGRCHSSCSCTLDTSQLKYLLTLSLTSQNQA